MWKTSTIVVTQNGNEIKELIKSIEQSNYDWKENEIIIYCNGSTPELVKWLYDKKQKYNNIVVISSPNESPYTNCLNVSTYLSDSPKLCFLYDDMKVPKNYQDFLDEENTLYCGQCISAEELAPNKYREINIENQYTENIIHYPFVIDRHILFTLGNFEIMYPNGLYIEEDLVLKYKLNFDWVGCNNKYQFEFKGLNYSNALYLKEDELAKRYFKNKWGLNVEEIFINGKFYPPIEQMRYLTW